VALGFGLLFVAAIPASAGALDPRAFAPVGPFPTAAGTYTFDTRGTATTLNGPNGVLLTGVVYNGIAVFDFSTITVNSNQVFVGAEAPLNGGGPGGLPLALLSRGDINVNGTIDVSAGFAFGGPGGFSGGLSSGSGPGAGADGSIADNTGTGTWIISGGGGFGGRGGNGGFFSFFRGNPTGVVPFGGAPGGGSYGNLAISLQGGSSGGTVLNARVGPSPGGGGGGAIEVGAVGGIIVSGSILANGGSAGSGGSGGGIFLHGDSVALSGVLSAQGGGGYSSLSFPLGGGGGGGGQVLIQAGPGGFTGNVGGINVSGGSGTTYPYLPFPGEDFSAAGAPGVVTINGTVVPEPTSLVLLGVGMLGVLACAWGSRLRGGATAADQGPGGPVE